MVISHHSEEIATTAIGTNTRPNVRDQLACLSALAFVFIGLFSCSADYSTNNRREI
ncbi:MAG: hypothetical protein K2X93_25710 [Candidatus Obscuribacterales bacterium]|nr:hypothetical protein [Candidatus Obscuribacterales bacterium]